MPPVNKIKGRNPALCFAYTVTVTTWVATNSPSTVFTVTVAVPAVAPDGADTVTVLPVMATVARAGTDELAVNSLLSASSGATFTANVVLEPAAIELVVGATLTPVTRMSPSASVKLESLTVSQFELKAVGHDFFHTTAVTGS